MVISLSLYKKNFWEEIRKNKVFKINRVLDCNLKQQLNTPKITDELSFSQQDPLMYIIRNNNNNTYGREALSFPNQTQYFNFNTDELWKIIKKSDLKLKDKKGKNAFFYLLNTQQLKDMNASQIKHIYNKSKAYQQPEIFLKHINQFNNCSKEDVETMLNQINWQMNKDNEKKPAVIYFYEHTHHFTFSENLILKILKESNALNNEQLMNNIINLSIEKNPQYLPMTLNLIEKININKLIYNTQKDNILAEEHKKIVLDILSEHKKKTQENLNKNQVF